MKDFVPEEKSMLEKIYNDNEVSFNERGLYVLMYMHGPTQFGEMLSNGRDRRSAIESGLRTLIDRGYARKVTTRNEKGMILKVFYEAIVTED